jgi:hypothetical protein
MSKKKETYRVSLSPEEMKLLGKTSGRGNRFRLTKQELDLIGGIDRYLKFRKNKIDLDVNSPNKPDGKDNHNEWQESSDGAFFKYEGTTSIRTLDQALSYSKVDQNKWEVERYIFNSWDVTMKGDDGQPITATNYQVKVWFTPKIKLDIQKPKYRHIKPSSGKAHQMWVIIGCVHRPFHDKVLWDKFLTFLEYHRHEITGIIINGDYLDLRSLSSHEEWIPEGIDLSTEYSDGLQGIDDIETRLKPDIQKIYHYGNHEDRFFRDKKSLRMYGASLPAPHEALELKQRGWEIMTDWKNGYTTLGNNLDRFHGVKVGMNAAKDQLQSLPTRDHIFNHTHRFGTYSNKTNTSYNIGCMIDFDADEFKYVDRGIRESWSHGFAVAYIDENKNNHVYPIKVAPDRSFFFKGVAY